MGGGVRLSRNFTLAEMDRHGEAEPHHVEALRALALDVLQPIRERWGALTVTSGFRSAARNVASGGSPTSQHLLGQAADLVPTQADPIDVWCWIASSAIPFGQVIFEERKRPDGSLARWVHVSSAADGIHGQVLRSPTKGVYLRVR